MITLRVNEKLKWSWGFLSTVVNPLGIHIPRSLFWVAQVEPWTSQYSWEAEWTGTSPSLVREAHNLSDLKQIVLESFRMVLFFRVERWPRKCKSFVCNAVLEALPYSHGYPWGGPPCCWLHGPSCSQHIPPFAYHHGHALRPLSVLVQGFPYQPGKSVGTDNFAPFRQMDLSLSEQFLVPTPAATMEDE